MAHFVTIPPPKNPGDHGISELSLRDPNGTCGIGVWGMPAGSSVRAESNHSFVAGEYKSHNKEVRFFYCRGLRAGDKIAAFLPGGGQYTSWLPIKFVRGDHFAKQRKAGTLPRSKHKSNFILDPHGAMQRKPPIKEADWTTAVEAAIVKLKSNPLGAAILGGLIHDITIAPHISSELNANSSVTFTPQQWKGAAAGDRADEVLLHELIHVLESNFSGYVNSPADGLKWDGTDFLTITATNLYSSLERRPLRAHHPSTAPMPFAYATNAASFKAAQAANFASVQNRLPAYYRVFAASSAPWNPFK
jgi:hypothetical protein